MSDNYGMIPAGFRTKRADDITSEIFDDLDSLWGTVKRSPESVIGQLVGVLSRPYTRVWLELEDLYMSMDPSSAEAIALDNICQFKNIVRKGATGTTVICSCFGTAGTIIPSGSKVASSNGDILTIVEEVTFDNLYINYAKFEGVDADLSIYRSVKLSYGSNSFEYDDTETLINFYNGLALAVEEAVADGVLPFGMTTSKTDDFIEIIDSSYSTFSVTSFDGLTQEQIGYYAVFVNDTTGNVDILQRTVNTIVTSTSGWNSVLNYGAGVNGSDIENDNDLRIRRRRSKRTGSNNSMAIETAIENSVFGVRSVTCYENEESVIANGLKPHSIFVVVDGAEGKEQEIADVIWIKKSTGIATNGDIEKTVVDSNGVSRVIRFGRPSVIYGWIRVVITATDPDFSLQSNFASTIAENIATIADEMQTGDDFSAGRFAGEVYSLRGVRSATIEVGTSASPDVIPTNWTSSYIDVSKLQRVVVIDKNYVSVEA